MQFPTSDTSSNHLVVTFYSKKSWRVHTSKQHTGTRHWHGVHKFYSSSMRRIASVSLVVETSPLSNTPLKSPAPISVSLLKTIWFTISRRENKAAQTHMIGRTRYISACGIDIGLECPSESGCARILRVSTPRAWSRRRFKPIRDSTSMRRLCWQMTSY